ncbi:putative reverse transcriptase domain-containing protein [Tanacetum coccineum]|uniref:Reverse transcriptase domain-containing protein n=1 Tax=Tanacetum coccineum TaxID=301880 RepID=A0ABQ5CL43_9ASTR
MAPSRRSGNNNNNEENPDIAIIVQQLQTILPQIVTQLTNNVNNANGGNGGNSGNGRNNGCTYKGFMEYNLKEYDGKGGAIALTRWIEKIENVIDSSGCAENQKVKGREAAIGMSWTDFKALLVEEFCLSNEIEKLESEFWNHKMVGANHASYTDQFHELTKLVLHLVIPESSRIKRYIARLDPQIGGMLRATQPTIIQSVILRAGILTDEAVSCGTLTKGNEKRKGVEESSKQGGMRSNDKRAKVSKGFVAATTHKNEYTRPHPKCAKCWTYHPEEVADGKMVEVDRVIRNFKLELGTFLFTIDLIPLGHGSFDVIVGMDWLSNHKAEIVCHEKVVRIPLESGEILHVQGERTPRIAKALSNVKVDEPKLSDISIVRDFVEVFPEDLLGLSPQRQVEFPIDLVSGATPVTKSPYRLAPSEMQELYAQL